MLDKAQNSLAAAVGFAQVHGFHQSDIVGKN